MCDFNIIYIIVENVIILVKYKKKNLIVNIIKNLAYLYAFTQINRGILNTIKKINKTELQV